MSVDFPFDLPLLPLHAKRRQPCVYRKERSRRMIRKLASAQFQLTALLPQHRAAVN